MSRGSCPLEAQSVVFYESRRLQGAQTLTALRLWVGPPKEPKTPETLEASEFEVWRLRRLEVTNVLRIVSLGGSGDLGGQSLEAGGSK